MPSAWILTPGSRASLEQGHLVITIPPPEASGQETQHRLPLHDVERLCVHEDASITTPALAELLRREIPVHVQARNGETLGSCLPVTPAMGRLRMEQYRLAGDAGFSIEIARRIIDAKLQNQARVLQRFAASREDTDSTPILRIRDLRAQIPGSSSPAELMGLEGSASATFYLAWAAWLPESFPFEHRSRRPPHNPVNACLSFAATLLTQELTHFLHSSGLDPGIGYLHATENGRWSLALDLVEPFRPPVVEAFTLELFSRRILGAGDFEPKQGGIYLNLQGRRTLIYHYERRMDREFLSEQTGMRTSLRGELEAQGRRLRQALDTGASTFIPFRMN